MVKIFIDPGHGGADPGAVGSQLREKDLTLSISLKLRDYLNKHYTGHSIKLSRTTDKTVSLKARTNAANSWNANYLISVHINSGGGTGFESYVYSKQKNAGTLKKQSTIHDEIIKRTEFVNRGKKGANLHMLRESKMSALLTENGFIDNKNDVAKLKSDAFLNKIAEGHAIGLAKALNLRKKTKPKPPAADSDLYTIKKGDTLWGLARKYNTSVNKIMELNPNIVPTSLQVGKQIALPNKEISTTSTYTIKKGDTLWSIARKYNTPVNKLIEINPNIVPTSLQIGQEIVLTGNISKSYTIKKGDTLWSIAKKYDTTVSQLIDLNPGTVATELKVGQKIKLK